MGLEGSPGPIGIVLYEEEDAFAHLEKQWDYLEQNDCEIKILVSHAPPKGDLDFSFRFGSGHIGSDAVLSFINDRSVDLVVCGHSHFNGGKYRIHGTTTVLNIAPHDGHDDSGRLAWVSVSQDGTIMVEGCEEIRIPVEWSDLLKLSQVGENRAKQMVARGIASLRDINRQNMALLKSLPGSSKWHAEMWMLFLDVRKD